MLQVAVVVHLSLSLHSSATTELRRNQPGASRADTTQLRSQSTYLAHHDDPLTHTLSALLHAQQPPPPRAQQHQRQPTHADTEFDLTTISSAAAAAVADIAAERKPHHSPLSLQSARSRAKAILATPAPAVARQAQLALLGEELLAARRPRAAFEVYELARARIERWRTTGDFVPLERSLLRVALSATAALRRRADFEALLGSAASELGESLCAEPETLSVAMSSAAAVGWRQNALAANASLHDAGLTPSSAALAALMEEALARGDAECALDTFVHMRRYGPSPDGRSHACAARAAVTRKSSWKPLLNLMRRTWLRVKWAAPAANAVTAALVRAGNLQSAAAAARHMERTEVPLRHEPLLELLRHASVLCGDADGSRKVFDALASGAGRDEAGGTAAVPAEAYLLMLPMLPHAEREPLLLRALDEAADPDGTLLLLTALAIHWSASAEGGRAAALLRWLEREGYDLGVVDANGQLASAFAADLRLAPGDARAFVDDASGDDAAGADMDAWLLVLRASATPSSAVALATEMQAGAELSADSAQASPAAAELVRVLCALDDLVSAVGWLRQLLPVAPPSAYAAIIVGSCDAMVPDITLATATFELMQASGAFNDASPSQVIEIFAGFVRGYGRAGQLEEAHSVFNEGHGWLQTWCDAEMRSRNGQRQAQLQRRLQEAEDARDAGFDALLVEEAEAAAAATARWIPEEVLLRRARARRSNADDERGAADGAVATRTDEATAAEEDERQVQAQFSAHRKVLHKAMIGVATVHPRGLLLACKLLEELEEAGTAVTDGYYDELIHGITNAGELREALESLRGGGPRIGGGWRVSDTTIASLMRSLRRSDLEASDEFPPLDDDPEGWQLQRSEVGRELALEELGRRGVVIDHKVADYLSMEGTRLGGKRRDNANDVLAAAERDTMVRDNDAPVDRRPPRRWSHADEEDLAPDESTKQMYEELDRLLAERDRRDFADGTKPERDTKRTVDFKHLANQPRLGRVYDGRYDDVLPLE